jgi:hypothetical protein
LRLQRWFLISLAVLVILSAYPIRASATGGLPNTAAFGYGARLDMWGQDANMAMDLATSLGLDWVAIDVDWSRHWPSIDQPADFSALDNILQAARQKHLSILLSLTHAPAWAMTASGPEPGITISLLQSILNVYPDVILAVELFPGVNSTVRWGTTPSPQAYLSMLQNTRQALNTAGQAGVYLVTTIEPIQPGSTDGSIDDQAFLDSLYSSGGLSLMPIVGIRYPVVMGEPMANQDSLYPIVLRHYESVRAVMLRYQHENGLIWITGFTWPTSGIANPADPIALPITPANQEQWVNQAFQLLRAQLFIGAAFFSSLNQATYSQPSPSLLFMGGTIHPACIPISRYADGLITSTSWTPPVTPIVSPAPPTSQSTQNNFLRNLDKPPK